MRRHLALPDKLTHRCREWSECTDSYGLRAFQRVPYEAWACGRSSLSPRFGPTGPFYGRDGTVAAIDAASRTVVVSADIFGRVVELDVSFEALRRSDESDIMDAADAASELPGIPATSRFAETIGDLHHAALFVRDAFRLDVGRGPGIPPRLATAVTEAGGELKAGDRLALTTAWKHWWSSDVLADGDAPPAGPAEPVWESIVVSPEARDAAVSCHRAGILFAQNRHRDFVDRSPEPHLSHEMVQTTAERVARESGRSPEHFDVAVTLIDVEGPWWAVSAPGRVLASMAVLGNPPVAQAVVEALFQSVL